MKLTILALALCAAGFAQTPQTVEKIDWGSLHSGSIKLSSSFSFISGYTGSPSSVSLQSTKGGGLQICEGYSCDKQPIAELLPDGTVKGDLVRAMRMLAAALAWQQKQNDSAWSKPEPPKPAK